MNSTLARKAQIKFASELNVQKGLADFNPPFIYDELLPINTPFAISHLSSFFTINLSRPLNATKQLSQITLETQMLT